MSNLVPDITCNEFLYPRNEHQKVRVSSLVVAEKFEKKHKNILQAIELLECSEEFNRLNFQQIDYVDQKGRTYKAYAMTRDGFMMLVMGFTGKKAATWKEAFIACYNRLEAKYREHVKLLAGLRDRNQLRLMKAYEDNLDHISLDRMITDRQIPKEVKEALDESRGLC